MHEQSTPPYFEQLLVRLKAEDPEMIAAFGRHVHWGYWSESTQVNISAEEYGQAAERLCLAVLSSIRVVSGQRILDVGCGFGGTIACLNEKFSDMHLVGVNIDPRQLKRASDAVTANNGNTVEFQEGDAAQLPFANSTFDVVLAVESAFHFDRQCFLAEASRVLRSGGRLAISDFCPSERATEYFQSLDLTSNEAVRWTYGKIDLNWSVSRYQESAASCDLQLIHARDITSHTLPTYQFLEASVKGWMESGDLEKFRFATNMLEKASRRGLINYQILGFEKA